VDEVAFQSLKCQPMENLNLSLVEIQGGCLNRSNAVLSFVVST
jgi:hypothetical protein